VCGAPRAGATLGVRPFAVMRVVVPQLRGPLEPTAAPTFSVLIAASQAARTIGEAIESALDQTHPPLEVIVCDDGSTDDLDRALAPYRDRVELIRQPRRGRAAACNSALRAASGDYVTILDAGSVYLPRRLEALGDLAAARPDLELLTTDCHLEAPGRAVRRYYEPESPFVAENQRSAILERNFILGPAAIPRRRLLSVGGFDEALRNAEDWDCWIRLILAGAQAGLVEEPLARYRLQPTGLSSQRVARLHARVRVLEKAGGNPDLRPDERAIAGRSLAARRRELKLGAADAALLEGRPDEARRWLRAVARDPGFRPGSRLRALAASLAPTVAARRVRAREGGTWTTAAGIRVTR
jgi:GT2 family glycosyltransferase